MVVLCGVKYPLCLFALCAVKANNSTPVFNIPENDSIITSINLEDTYSNL